MNLQEITDYQYFLASPFFAELVDFDAPDTKIFIKSFCGLSIPLRDFLSSPDVAAVIISLGEKYGLQEKQITSFSKLIKDLILGKIFIKDLPVNLSSNLRIDEMKSSQLINDLVSQSFGPIIEDIKLIQRTKFPDRVMTMRETIKPPNLPAQKPPILQEMRPPLSRPPLNQQQIRPVMPQRPSYMSPPTTRPPISPQPQNRPQFRVPNLSPFDSAQSKPLDTAQGKSLDSALNRQQGSTDIQKSLDDELEKVANVIDLRTGPKNQSSSE